jgi:hypothetical protein
MSNKVIAASLGIEYVPEGAEDEEATVEELDESEVPLPTEGEVDVVGELLGPEKEIGHVEADYEYTRSKMKTFLELGETGLKDLMENVKEEPSARSYEVLSNMLGTVTDMATKFFDLQKKNKELHLGSLAAVGAKPDIAIRNGVVFTGDSADMLQRLKEKKNSGTES